jgi:hypothetical protein
MDYASKTFFPDITLYLTFGLTAFETSYSITDKIYFITLEKSKFSMECVLQTRKLLGMGERVTGLRIDDTQK